MLLRQKRLEHNQINLEKNRDASTAGQQKFAAGEELQGNIQGSLSDLVRATDGKPSQEQLKNWEDSLEEFSPHRITGKRKRIGTIRSGVGYVKIG
jgi:hypothetical protein